MKNNRTIRRLSIYSTLATILVINSHSLLLFIDRGHIDIVIAIMGTTISIFLLLTWYRLVSLFIYNDQLIFNQGFFNKGHHFTINSIQEVYVDALNSEPFELNVKTDSSNIERVSLKDPKSEVLNSLLEVLGNKVKFHPSIKLPL